MSWRFKASKYKNAAPIVPKPEMWIRDLSVGSYQTYGNNICASAALMAFNWEHAGSSLAVLPLDDCGRKSKTMPLLHGHTDTVTDMQFSPFHDGLLATGSQDCLVKLWHIPKEGLKESLTTPECVLSQKQRRVENIGFHPTADGLMHVASGHQISLWDLVKQNEVFTNTDHGEIIQSTSWKRDGCLLVTSCKDKKLRIIDARAKQSIVDTCNSHQNIKDSRVVWLGEQDKILTTGFDSARLRQIILRDVRKLSSPVKTLELDCSTGILMPLFDPDTSMLFLAGKGDTTILYMEVTDREPFLVEGLRHSGEQTKGACLVPKRAVRVMEGEVNRLLQLTSNNVIPIMYQVPRKTYREYHSDLYPNTYGCITRLSSTHWLQGQDLPVETISLDPSKHQVHQVHRGSLNNVINDLVQLPSPKQEVKECRKTPVTTPTESSMTLPKIDSVVKKTDDTTDRVDFVNVKDLVKDMEKQKDLSKLKEIHSKDYESKNDENGLESAAGDKKESSMNGAPKPFPRSSISECGSMIELPQLCQSVPEIPKPKPRSQSAVYKPRLGPKPFSASHDRDQFSFDKVFSVPSAPGHSPPVRSNSVTLSTSTPKENGDHEEKTSSPTSDLDVTTSKESDFTNGKSDSSLEEEVNSSDSGYKPKTPSTAERRKLFENEPLRRANSHIETPSSPALIRRRDSLKTLKQDSDKVDEKRASVPNINSKRTSTVFGRVSKFRHLKLTPAHKSQHIENIKNIRIQISGECNGFYANELYCAVPLGGGGGRVGIVSVGSSSSSGGGANGVPPPALLHTHPLTDWAWDPFQPNTIIVACDDGSVREWVLPDNGLKESTNEPNRCWSAHPDKIYLIRFHPTAANIITTAAHDLTVKIWDLSSDPPELKITLEGHTDQIFNLEWSPYGEQLATYCKDGLIRIYHPRSSTRPVMEGKGPIGGRGGRIVWALNDTHLIVTGFDKVSERQILVYEVDDLSKPKCTVSLDVSPAILQIHIDHDSNTIFVTGRGDLTIYCFEICCEDGQCSLSPLTHCRMSTPHQGVSFLHKRDVQVERVEFLKLMRLVGDRIEPCSFTVPRLKTEYFQDDLFPPTLVTWSPWMSANDWFAGKSVSPVRVSLQPEGMELLSEHMASLKESKEFKNKQLTAKESKHALLAGETIKEKQENIFKSMSARVHMNMKLEQDNMEGVDESEWD